MTSQHYDFYTREGIPAVPKRIFVHVADAMDAAGVGADASLLDVGCANGALTHYLMHRFPGRAFAGSDYFEDMVAAARDEVPGVAFSAASVLDMPKDMWGKFDVVTCVGVLMMFDENTLPVAVENLIKCARPGGRVFVVSTCNEYGVDLVMKWRHRTGDDPESWVSDRNVYSFETYAEILKGRCKSHRFLPCPVDIPLERTGDPRRAWTIRTEKNEHQLTSDLKLCLDQYILEITA